jgi:hypothetical protein
MTKIIAFALAAGLTTVSAMGQSFAIVKVPFTFFVGDKELPAGSYQIETVSTKAMRITNLERKDKAVAFTPIAVTGGDTSPNAANQTKLVFTRYGTDYYLSEMWAPGTLTGRAIIKSEQEVALAKRLPPVRVEAFTASRP